MGVFQTEIKIRGFTMKDVEKKRRPDMVIIVLIIIFFIAFLVTLINFAVIRRNINNSYNVENQTQPVQYEKHFVLINNNEKTDVWNSIYESAMIYANEHKAYVEMPINNFETEYNKYELFEMAILENVDGIIVEGDGSEKLRQLISDARDKGIPVVTIMTDAYDSKRNSFVGASSYDVGRELGNQILHTINEKARPVNNIMILLSTEDTRSSQHTMYLAIMEKISRLFGGKISVEFVDNSTSFSTDETIRDIFINMDNNADIMVCLSDEIMSSAYQAAVEYNKVGKFDIMGFASSDDVLDGVKRGIINCVMTYDRKVMGRNCVEALLEYIDNGYVSEYLMVDTTFVKGDNSTLTDNASQ